MRANPPASEALSWRWWKARLRAWPAVGTTTEARALFAERRKSTSDSPACWTEHSRLRPELRDLPSAETMVCRCEDVPYSRLQRHIDRGAPPNCRRAAAWGRARAESAGPPHNFFSSGIRIRCGLRFFPRVLKIWRDVQPGSEPEHSADHRRLAMNWKGVMPAITTCFNEDLQHRSWLHGRTLPLAAGQRMHRHRRAGIAGRRRDSDHSTRSWRFCEPASRRFRARAGGRCNFRAFDSGGRGTSEGGSRSRLRGLMVLPPYVYKGDWREMKTHVAAVFRATPLSCMLYNNPVAYGTDFLPEQIQRTGGGTRESCSG